MEQFRRGALVSLVEKLIKMSSQLVIMTLLARALGADRFGALMYCYAIVALLNFLNSLGLETLLVRYLIENKVEKDRREVLTHSLIIRLSFSLACILLANILGYFIVNDEQRALLFVMSLLHLCLPFTVFTSAFQAKGRSDLASVALIAGSLMSLVYVLLCLYYKLSLIFIAGYFVLDTLVVAVISYCMAKSNKIFLTKAIRLSKLIAIFKDCLPMIISGGITLLYMKLDQIMIGYICGSVEVGVYVAATRLSEAWYFVGLTLIGVYYPKILKIKENNGYTSYCTSIVKYGRLIVWPAIALAVFTTVFAELIIEILYGKEYERAATVLAVTIWAVPFVYLGSLSTKMYVAASRQNMLMWRSLTGLIVNLMLNLIFIPLYGATGAALTTLIAQICVGVLFNLSRALPAIFRVQLRILIFSR